MSTTTRADRVGGLVQEVISELLRRSIRDPRLARATITGVKMTADLRLARIYFVTPSGADRAREAAEGFARAQGFIKRHMAGELNLRYMPDLEFHYDESIDYGEHIERLLKRIHTEDDTDRHSN